MVKLLTDSGADVFALSEGDAPFAPPGLAATMTFARCWPL